MNPYDPPVEPNDPSGTKEQEDRRASHLYTWWSFIGLALILIGVAILALGIASPPGTLLGPVGMLLVVGGIVLLAVSRFLTL